MDALKRGARTLLQVGFVSVVISIGQEFDWINWTETQTVAVIAVATPIVAFLLNLLKDNTSMPVLLKQDTYHPHPHG